MMRTYSADRASQRRVHRESQLDECSLSSSLRTEKERQETEKKKSDEGKKCQPLFSSSTVLSIVGASLDGNHVDSTWLAGTHCARLGTKGPAAPLAAVWSSPADDLSVPQVMKENLEAMKVPQNRVIELAESSW